jgi:hypothetical protein
MTPGERVSRGDRARQLVEGDLKEVFEGVRIALLERLESSAIGDRDSHHEITLTLQLLKQLKGHLVSYMQDGKLAEKEMEQENWLVRAKRKFA